MYFRIQIKQFVIGLFTFNDDFNKFKTHLRDFLISLKEFAGDNAELYAEEREQALRDAKAAERDRAMKVGGLLKPSEMDQEDELWLEHELRSEFAQPISTEVAECLEESDNPTGKDWLDGWSLYGLWKKLEGSSLWSVSFWLLLFSFSFSSFCFPAFFWTSGNNYSSFSPGPFIFTNFHHASCACQLLRTQQLV